MSTLNKILYMLKIRGMTDRELSHKIGVSPSTISDWKSGKTSSYNKHIKAIAEALDVSVEYLLDEGIGADNTPTHWYDDMLEAISIELDVPVQTLKDILKNNRIPDGFPRTLNKKNLVEYFSYYLDKDVPFIQKEVANITDQQAELLEVSNTLTEDEISEVMNYIEYVKSKRIKRN